jgi:hypothetical protein
MTQMVRVLASVTMAPVQNRNRVRSIGYLTTQCLIKNPRNCFKPSILTANWPQS